MIWIMSDDAYHFCLNNTSSFVYEMMCVNSSSLPNLIFNIIQSVSWWTHNLRKTFIWSTEHTDSPLKYLQIVPFYII